MIEREHLSEIKIVKFAEGLLAPTLTGNKEISLRKYRPEAHDLHEGEIFIGSFFEEGLDLLLQAKKDTEVKTFNDLTNEEAQADGFVDVDDAFEKMHKYYPDLVREDKLAILRYEIAKIKGMPAVKTNASFSA